MNSYEALKFVFKNTPARISFTEKNPLTIKSSEGVEHQISFKRVHGMYLVNKYHKETREFDVRYMTINFSEDKIYLEIKHFFNSNKQLYEVSSEDLIKRIKGTFTGFMYQKLLTMDNSNYGEVFKSIIEKSKWAYKNGDSYIFSKSDWYYPTKSGAPSLTFTKDKIFYKEDGSYLTDHIECRIKSVGPCWFEITIEDETVRLYKFKELKVNHREQFFTMARRLPKRKSILLLISILGSGNSIKNIWRNIVIDKIKRTLEIHDEIPVVIEPGIISL